MKAEMTGRYKLVTKGATRGEIDHGWSDNAILDSGIARLLGVDGDVITHIQVGTSSTAVDPVNDKGLKNWLVGTGNTAVDSGKSFGWNNSEGFGWTRLTRQFGEGVAAGIIAEVGAGWAANGDTLFSRALITDGAGNPTTITVLSDEYLTVIYELRRFWVLPEPHVMTYDDDGVIQETTISYNMPINTNATGLGNGGNKRLPAGSGGGNDTKRTRAIALQTHSSDEASPPESCAWLSDTQTVNSIDISVTFPLGRGNSAMKITGGGQTTFGYAVNGGTIPCHTATSGVADGNLVNSSIPRFGKTNQFILTLTFTLTITRKED